SMSATSPASLSISRANSALGWSRWLNSSIRKPPSVRPRIRFIRILAIRWNQRDRHTAPRLGRPYACSGVRTPQQQATGFRVSLRIEIGYAGILRLSPRRARSPGHHAKRLGRKGKGEHTLHRPDRGTGAGGPRDQHTGPEG